jgi:hypothetical protein
LALATWAARILGMNPSSTAAPTRMILAEPPHITRARRRLGVGLPAARNLAFVTRPTTRCGRLREGGTVAGRGGWQAVAAACVLGATAPGCAPDKGAGELHAAQVLLEREVKGLRASVAKLDRGEPLFPEEAVVVSIAEDVVKEFVNAQLPVTIELDHFRIELKEAKATFRGTPSVTLTGTILHKDHPDFVGEVSAIGALDSIAVEEGAGTLRASVAVDHVELLKMGGLEKFLGGGTVDELARTVRKQLAGRIPKIQIPVKIEQAIDLPSITDGPVRLQGASMPLSVSVSDVVAGQGVLWIAIGVVPGELVKAPEQDAR